MENVAFDTSHLGRDAVDSYAAYSLKVTGAERIVFLVSFVPVVRDGGVLLSDVVFEKSTEQLPESVRECLVHQLDNTFVEVDQAPLAAPASKGDSERRTEIEPNRYALAMCAHRGE